jgi:hypothetical protein
MAPPKSHLCKSIDQVLLAQRNSLQKGSTTTRMIHLYSNVLFPKAMIQETLGD